MNQLLFPLVPWRKGVHEAENTVLISKIKQTTNLCLSSSPCPPHHLLSEGHVTIGGVTSVKLMERHDVMLLQVITTGMMVSIPKCIHTYTHTHTLSTKAKTVKQSKFICSLENMIPYCSWMPLVSPKNGFI